MDHGAATVQPAGPAGKRHVFLTLAFDDDEITRKIEFVLSKRAAHHLGEALIAGSAGATREFNLADALE
jgi:hypothetical protein